MKPLNFFVFVRLILGAIFVVSGIEKLLAPYQNFLYVIQGYEILPHPALETLAAVVFPWLELILGFFLFLGLWIRVDLFFIGSFGVMFFIIVGRAIILKLPVSDCGCFGDFLYLPLTVTLSIDVLTVVASVFMLFFINMTSVLSLDEFFCE